MLALFSTLPFFFFSPPADTRRETRSSSDVSSASSSSISTSSSTAVAARFLPTPLVALFTPFVFSFSFFSIFSIFSIFLFPFFSTTAAASRKPPPLARSLLDESSLSSSITSVSIALGVNAFELPALRTFFRSCPPSPASTTNLGGTPRFFPSTPSSSRRYPASSTRDPAFSHASTHPTDTTSNAGHCCLLYANTCFSRFASRSSCPFSRTNTT